MQKKQSTYYPNGRDNLKIQASTPRGPRACIGKRVLFRRGVPSGTWKHVQLRGEPARFSSLP